jgi:hypothetical protein
VRRRIRKFFIGVLVAIGVLGLAASSAGARVIDCANYYGHPHSYAQGNGPRNDRLANVGNLSAPNLSCSAARHAIKYGSLNEFKGRFHTRGFYCYVIQQSRLPGGVGPNGPYPPLITGQTIRCVRPGQAFRFGWAT